MVDAKKTQRIDIEQQVDRSGVYFGEELS